MGTLQPFLSCLLIFLSLSFSVSSPLASTTYTSRSPSAKAESPKKPPLSSSSFPVALNPFAAKAAAIRYWDRKTPSQHPHPVFILSKLSPLSAIDSATYSSLAASDPSSLTARLPSFCAAAHLLCSSSFTASVASRSRDSNFANYNNINFTNYGTRINGGLDSFKNYSPNQLVPIDSFRGYSRESVFRDESFATYSPNGTVITDNFTSYAISSVGGSGDFTSYGRFTRVPELNFRNYEINSNGHTQNFTSYSDDTVAGDVGFSVYGKHTNGVPIGFTSYSNNSNLVISDFRGYGEGANGPEDTFTKYANNRGSSHEYFRSYGDDATGAIETFSSYRGEADVGDANFQSYGKRGNIPTVNFTSYGNEFKTGEDHFKGYGEGNTDPHINFKTYLGNPSDFKAYADLGVTFKDYRNITRASTTKATSDKPMPKRWVEPGRFFRERDLKEGKVMPMPDIRDKMPARSFLPRAIAGKLPFSAPELARIFNVPEGTALSRAISDTVAECARAPSRGETKRCPTSAEDMVDFAVSVLGDRAVPRTTDSARGSGGDIMVGRVRGANGGKVTKSVSCHQSLFPYLVYYCHSVPMVRVYEAEILSLHTKEKINHGVAICHLDTSDWSAGHGAFVALGSKPGKIEVCHWIFQGDMTWVAAD